MNLLFVANIPKTFPRIFIHPSTAISQTDTAHHVYVNLTSDVSLSLHLAHHSLTTAINIVRHFLPKTPYQSKYNGGKAV